MAEASFNNFFNKPFGLNVKSHERTLQLAGKTLTNTAGGVFEPLFTYLKENEEVFNGDIKKETNKYFASSFNIGARMQEEDIKVNGAPPRFDTKF